MPTINVLTAERTIEIEDAIIVSAAVNGSGHLILTRNDDTTVDAGSVEGPAGVSGAVSVTDLEDVPGGTPAGTPIFLHA